MEYQSGCLICGKELVYSTRAETHACNYCGAEQETATLCVDGHFVCDHCHSLSANDLIEQYCTYTTATDPIDMAITLMKNPSIKMHGPEHHFLVPAVLLTAYDNLKGAHDKAIQLKQARKRAENVLGGFCGFYGACGAAVGTGIFVSVVTGATPLSKKEWSLSNRITGECLMKIAAQGGPRCCKRDSFLALLNAVKFTRKHFDIEFPAADRIRCDFTSLNSECLMVECPFYPAN